MGFAWLKKTMMLAAAAAFLAMSAALGVKFLPLVLGHGGYRVSESFQPDPPLAKCLAEKNLAVGDEVFIRIFKESREFEIWMRGDGRAQFEYLRTYPICFFSGALGPKLQQGDRQAPEGFYFTNRGRLNPNSSYHLSFNVGYPNAYDRAHNRTGSLIMVHGECVSIGCFAMTNPGIEEIYGLVEAALKKGQPIVRIHSFPFRMSQMRMSQAREDKWYPFWENLKEGYDWFERERVPPNTEVSGKRYVFSHSG